MQGNAAKSSERNGFEQTFEQMVLHPTAATPLSNHEGIRDESVRRCVDREITGLPGTRPACCRLIDQRAAVNISRPAIIRLRVEVGEGIIDFDQVMLSREAIRLPCDGCSKPRSSLRALMRQARPGDDSIVVYNAGFELG